MSAALKQGDKEEMKNLILKLKVMRDTRGQDLIEYALMAGFVAVAAGDTAAEQFTNRFECGLGVDQVNKTLASRGRGIRLKTAEHHQIVFICNLCKLRIDFRADLLAINFKHRPPSFFERAEKDFQNDLYHARFGRREHAGWR